MTEQENTASLEASPPPPPPPPPPPWPRVVLDYLEELAGDERPYVDGLPVAGIVTASGWQAAVNTLRALRETVHALRGWPTPLGLAVNVAGGLTDPETGTFRDPRLEEQARGRHRAARVRPLGGRRRVRRRRRRRGGARGRAAAPRDRGRPVRARRGGRVPSARAIAEQLGVTPATARQGIDRLVDAHVLVRSGSAAAVASGMFERDAEAGERGLAEVQAAELREAIETAAARLAALRRDDEDIAVLRAALARVHESRRERGAAAVARFAEADGALHAAVAKAGAQRAPGARHRGCAGADVPPDRRGVRADRAPRG